jgi:hypothetical protein
MNKNVVEGMIPSIVLALLMACCGAAAGEEPANNGNSSAGPGKIVNKAVKVKTSLKCKKGTRLDYQNFGQGFLLNYCTTCHSSEISDDARMGAPITINLDSADAVQVWRARILKVVKPGVVETGTPSPDDDGNSAGGTDAADDQAQAVMPPDGSLLAEDRSLFLEWLNCGAPAGNP